MGVDPILNINGVISGSGDLTIAAPNGRVRFINANTYTGTTNVQSGMLEAVNASALGSASQGTTVQFFSGLTIFGSVAGEHLTLHGSGWHNDGALILFAGSGTWSGDVDLATDTKICTLNGATLTLSGVVSGGAATLSFESLGTAGTLVLTGANAYPETAVVSGTVRIDGSQPINLVTVDGALSIPGVLGGSGTVGTVNGHNTGTVSPGASPGILHVSGFGIDTGSTFKVELNSPNVGTGYDQVSASGFVDLLGTLQVVPGFTPIPGTLFRIIDKSSAGAISGTFNALPEGAYFVASGQEFQISYVGGSGNDVVLKAIAPPTTTIVPAGPTDLCDHGGMVTLTAQPPTGGSTMYSAYSWYKNGTFTGATGPIYNATMPGSYTVRVTDSVGLTGPDGPASIVNQDGTAPIVTPPSSATTTQTLCQ